MATALLERLGIAPLQSGVCTNHWLASPGGPVIESLNPATGEILGRVQTASAEDCDRCAASLSQAFLEWRSVPPPRRGEVVRRLGEVLRQRADDLALLVTLETGKIRSEGLGEVREMIDMCDFAVGLSRQLYGYTIASERPDHKLIEQWHPLGPVGVITAFNFPVAVWAWNAMLAAVCGDVCLWKPSPLTPLTAIAVQQLARQVLTEFDAPPIFQLCVGDAARGAQLAADLRFPLISATGSCAMGRHVAVAVAARWGRSLLELGGNNGAIVSQHADLELTVRAIAFAAVGTAGQRCTTLRRLFVHRSRLAEVTARLASIYNSIRIGDPLDDQVLVGPLIRPAAVEAMQAALTRARDEGAAEILGGEVLPRPGNFVRPALVCSEHDLPVAREETFAPILYVSPYDTWDEVIARHNAVEQGLSSAIFTTDMREAWQFLSPSGSDCGLANVNLGTSGAEIGGAFGGEKATGGGREAGSDAWKAYMRRQTCTLNYGHTLPLAQGVRFDVDGN
jgi:aldehyde dehydrogenase (NAD+)